MLFQGPFSSFFALLNRQWETKEKSSVTPRGKKAKYPTISTICPAENSASFCKTCNWLAKWTRESCFWKQFLRTLGHKVDEGEGGQLAIKRSYQRNCFTASISFRGEYWAIIFSLACIFSFFVVIQQLLQRWPTAKCASREFFFRGRRRSLEIMEGCLRPKLACASQKIRDVLAASVCREK